MSLHSRHPIDATQREGEVSAAGSILAYVRENGRFPGGEAIPPAQPERSTAMQTIETPYGRLEVDPASLELGELLVTDEGAELEVVSLDPLRLEPAPEEEEDWGE